MKVLAIGITALLLLITSASHGQVYRWVDSKGKVHYSDKPQSDKPASIKSTTNNSSPKDTSYRQQLEKQQRLLDSYSQRRAENQRQRAQQEQKQKQHQDKLKIRCAGYKYYLDTGGGVYKKGANGERIFMKEPELADYRAKKQAEYNKYCQ